MEERMMKRTIAMLLALIMALSMLPVTALAAGSGRREIGGAKPYATYYEAEPNNTMAYADYIDATDAYVDAEVGRKSTGDTADWFWFEIDRDYRLQLMAVSGAGGCNTTQFEVFDDSGALVEYNFIFRDEDPHEPNGDDASDDTVFAEVDLHAGKYYIRVIDLTYWVDYSFETVLFAKHHSPVVTASNRASDGKIVLNWNYNAEVEQTGQYSILRATSKNGNYSSLATAMGNETSYVDTSAQPGVTYYYKVIAGASVVYINSFPSNIVSRTCDLAKPTGVKVTRNADTGKNKISWNAVSGADKYSVYGSTDGTNFSLLTTVTGTSVTHNSATLGTTYYYKVKAVDKDNSSANSAYSSIVSGTATCAKPVITVSNVASTGKIKISWSAVTGAKSYDVYRSADGSTWTRLTNTTSTSVTNTKVNAGETWYYSVIARGNSSKTDSSRSAAKSRTCDLPQPTGVKISLNKTSGRNTISWTAVSGADKYSLYASSNGGSTWTKLTTVTGTSVTHNSATPGTTYQYKVMAVDGNNSSANSAYSAVVSGTAVCAKPVITVSNVASTGKIQVSWTAVTGAAKYTLYVYDANGNLLKSTNTTGTSLTHSTAVAGTTYTYKVKALGSTSATNSALSDGKSRTCDLPAPTLTVTTNYKVYGSSDGGSTWTLLTTMTGTAVTHNSASKGVTYRYRVMAVASNSAANSAYSGAVSVTVR